MSSLNVEIFYYSAHVLSVEYVIACLQESDSMNVFPGLSWWLIYVAAEGKRKG